MALLRWQNIVDFVVLTTAIYLLLRWGKDAKAFRVSLGIVALRALALLARQLDLVITGLVLDGANLIAVILLLIVYQNELRHALTRLDVMAWLLRRRKTVSLKTLDAIAAAAFSMAAARCGALIAIERGDPLGDLVDGGVHLGGEVSPEILEAVFQKTSPVHDGAVILESDRIARVGAILPLTYRTDIPKEFGTRHRAAIGLAERSDALVIVVSEERGSVSLMHDRQADEIQNPQTLTAQIEKLQGSTRAGAGTRIRDIVLGDLGLKSVALGVAALFWVIAFFPIGTSVRTVTVPVEFMNVPANTEIAQLSANSIQVEIRGSAWVMDSMSLGTLVARFDLTNAKEGPMVVEVQQSSLNLPPGLIIENVSPRKISLNLAPTAVEKQSSSLLRE